MNNATANILCETSTIADGNMSFRVGETHNSLENRKQFLARHAVDFKNHVCMKCNHESTISTIHRTNGASKAGIFGAEKQEQMILSEVLATQEKGLALMLLTADCLPVSFFDPVTQTIALAHFSRQTIAQLLPQKTISFLREEYKIDPSNLLIHIGPHIHTDSYTFPLPQPDLPPAIVPFVFKTGAHVSIDILSACTHQLTEEGILPGNISTSDIDTATSSDHFSHYRSKKQNAPEGRLATILMLR